MLANPMNIPPVSIATAKAALIEQYDEPVLRRRATMLWGPRALQIVEQLPDTRGSMPLPIREAQTLAMERLLQRALEQGLEGAVLDSPAYQRYVAQRHA